MAATTLLIHLIERHVGTILSKGCCCRRTGSNENRGMCLRENKRYRREMLENSDADYRCRCFELLALVVAGLWLFGAFSGLHI
jgi:hypothetical protein